MSRRIRVLVVDDSPSVAALHGMFVAAHPDCDVAGFAASGPEAVSAMRELHPDLVLLDVHLPGFSGLEALRIIRSDLTCPQPDVIAVTAARDIDTVRTARVMGVRHYLVKPFTAHDLDQRLDDVIRDRLAVLASPPALGQDQVDAMMRPAERLSLPKGITAETLDLVVASLESNPDSTAADIGSAVGLSRVTSRRYLEHLADGGTVRRVLDYSTSGRPATRYRLQSLGDRTQ